MTAGHGPRKRNRAGGYGVERGPFAREALPELLGPGIGFCAPRSTARGRRCQIYVPEKFGFSVTLVSGNRHRNTARNPKKNPALAWSEQGSVLFSRLVIKTACCGTDVGVASGRTLRRHLAYRLVPGSIPVTHPADRTATSTPVPPVVVLSVCRILPLRECAP